MGSPSFEKSRLVVGHSIDSKSARIVRAEIRCTGSANARACVRMGVWCLAWRIADVRFSVRVRVACASLLGCKMYHQAAMVAVAAAAAIASPKEDEDEMREARCDRTRRKTTPTRESWKHLV